MAVCTAAGDQRPTAIAADGAGGAIVTWRDDRSGNWDIYAQRVSAAGVPQWAANGVALCIATGDQWPTAIVADGAGGAIVTWYDFRVGDSDIYVQRITSSGSIASGWPLNGVALCTAAGDQLDPEIVSDGAGGAIITWRDNRSGNDDIYAQRVTASGSIAAGWPANGVALCTAAAEQLGPEIVSDAAGGAIVTWYDFRSGNSDIYAQRVTASGSIAAGWPENGVTLCTGVGDQLGPQIASDGAGGAIVAWRDSRGGSWDIYAQRVMSSGSIASAWPEDGVALCSGVGPQIVSDGAGGAIVTCSFSAQRVTSSGSIASGWPVEMISAPRLGYRQPVSDGAGGAIMTSPFHYEEAYVCLLVQRVSAAGVLDWYEWLSGGCPFQSETRAVADGTGGAVVGWLDHRNGNGDVYAQRVTLPRPSDLSASLEVATGRVSLTWSDNSSDETSFRVESKVAGTSDQSYALVFNTAANVNHGTDWQRDGLPHEYRVRAVRNSAYSAYSNVATGEAAVQGAPKPAGLVAKSVGDRQRVRLHIQPPEGGTSWSGVSSVEVQYSQDPGFAGATVLPATPPLSSAELITDVAVQMPDTQYFFRARNVFLSGAVSDYTGTASGRALQAPVMFLHGICQDFSAWGSAWASTFGAMGYAADRLNFVSFRDPRETWAAWTGELAGKIYNKLKPGDAWENDEAVDIVAYSQGGLAARAYIEQFGRSDRVRTLFMLGTPNHGAPLAMEGRTPCNWSGEQAADLVPGSTALSDLNFGSPAEPDAACQDSPPEIVPTRMGSTVYYAVAGTAAEQGCQPGRVICWSLEAMRYATAGCVGDGIVPWKSVRLRALLIGPPTCGQWFDYDIPGVGRLQHSQLGYQGRPFQESQELAEFVAGRLMGDSLPAGLSNSMCAQSATALPRSLSPESTPADSLAWIATQTDTLQNGEEKPYSVAVDSCGSFTVVVYAGRVLPVALTDPEGTTYSPADTSVRGFLRYEEDAKLGAAAFQVSLPSPGVWRIRVSGNPGPSVEHIAVDWTASGASYLLTMGLDRAQASPGEEVVISGTLARGAQRVPALASAVIVAPDQSVTTTPLLDTGAAGDSLAGDRVYAARYLVPAQDGAFHVRVTAQADSGLVAVRAREETFTSTHRPELAVLPNGLSWLPSIPVQGQVVDLSAKIHNLGPVAANAVVVTFEDHSTAETLGSIGTQVAAGDSAVVSVSHAFQVSGLHQVLIRAELSGGAESGLGNNIASMTVPVSAPQSPVGLGEGPVPARFEFAPPRPNPTGGEVFLDFTAPREAFVSLAVYDIQGRLVRSVMRGLMPAGRHSITWDGKDRRGAPSRSGVYFVRFEAPGVRISRAAVLIR